MFVIGGLENGLLPGLCLKHKGTQKYYNDVRVIMNNDIWSLA